MELRTREGGTGKENGGGGREGEGERGSERGIRSNSLLQSSPMQHKEYMQYYTLHIYTGCKKNIST